jgi:hypothetical protein
MISEYRIRAHNSSEASENRMHSDDVARRYGFQGGLVPGVTVFAYMTRPVVAYYGGAWLEHGCAEVTLAKPAYEGDMLTVSPAPGDEHVGEHSVVCTNEAGVELARMRAGMPSALAAADRRAGVEPAPPLAARPEATWDLMAIGEPFPALAWRPKLDDNVAWCEDVNDDLPLYREGGAPFLHPGFVLRQANLVLRNRFLLPAWIHIASRITFHRALRAGTAYEVRAIPEEKWERKGHEFVRLYVAIRAGEEVAAEIIHTAIFRPRRAEASVG